MRQSALWSIGIVAIALALVLCSIGEAGASLEERARHGALNSLTGDLNTYMVDASLDVWIADGVAGSPELFVVIGETGWSLDRLVVAVAKACFNAHRSTSSMFEMSGVHFVEGTGDPAYWISFSDCTAIIEDWTTKMDVTSFADREDPRSWPQAEDERSALSETASDASNHGTGSPQSTVSPNTPASVFVGSWHGTLDGGREWGSAGEVYLDGKLKGDLRDRDYLDFQMTPGSHEIKVRIRTKSKSWMLTYQLDAEPGGRYQINPAP
jgi:hypothetical protein